MHIILHRNLVYPVFIRPDSKFRVNQISQAILGFYKKNAWNTTIENSLSFTVALLWFNTEGVFKYDNCTLKIYYWVMIKCLNKQLTIGDSLQFKTVKQYFSVLNIYVPQVSITFDAFVVHLLFLYLHMRLTLFFTINN